MKYSVIEFTREEKYIKEFLELPGRLYSKKELMQNKEEELAVLNETHPLSHYFHIHRLLVTDEGKRTVCRFTKTTGQLTLDFLRAKTAGEHAACFFTGQRSWQKKRAAIPLWVRWTPRSGFVTVSR